VEARRSLDVGDREKMRDGKPVSRRHLVDLLIDLDLAHGLLRCLTCASLAALRDAILHVSAEMPGRRGPVVPLATMTGISIAPWPRTMNPLARCHYKPFAMGGWLWRR